MLKNSSSYVTSPFYATDCLILRNRFRLLSTRRCIFLHLLLSIKPILENHNWAITKNLFYDKAIAIFFLCKEP